MEQSLSTVAFKGSIPEAIAEAKQQKKLFVVYISGDNPESRDLETCTWINPNVSETLTKYCILLHLLEGSPEASQFSSIYPQKYVPSITAIGYNGVQLWQKDGLVAPDALASSLEKAWSSLHVQETTAAFLFAALASGGQLAPGTSETTPEQESPRTNESPPPVDNHVPSPDIGLLSSNATEERNLNEDEPLSEPSHVNIFETAEIKEPTSITNREKSTSVVHVKVGQSTQEELVSALPGENIDTTNGSSQEIFDRSNAIAETNLNENKEPEKTKTEVEQVNTPESKEVEKADAHETKKVEKSNASEAKKVEKAKTGDESKEIEKAKTDDESKEVGKLDIDETKEVEKVDKSNDVFLNIRLPDGSSLQAKFSVTDTLRIVKDYTNNNQTSSLGSFDLAIPYPRKVFTDQELSSTLSELSLFNRQALVVVPHKQTNTHHEGGSSLDYQSSLRNDDDIRSNGYWASLKGILSYVNPFSYFSGGGAPANATQAAGSGPWQYNPISTGNPRGATGASSGSSSDQSRSSTSKPQSSRFGGNIHTLKHEEDDDPRPKRNTFWNGNSTQFGGGNDDDKK